MRNAPQKGARRGLKEGIAVRLRVLLGLGCLLGSLVACATGGKFAGTGGSHSDGGSGGTGGGGGDTTTSTGGGGGDTTTTSTTTTAACTESPCKLVAPQCGCAGGEMCAINGDGDRECHTAGDKQVDQACTGLYACAPGTLCTLVSSSVSICTRYCAADADCGGGLCVLQLNDPSNPSMPLAGVSLCSDDCDPVSGSGCPGGLGLGCQLGQADDAAMTVFSLCTGAGAGTQGAACTDNEDCAPGLACFNAGSTQCLQWCKPPNGACPAGTACSPFQTPLLYKGVEYGACL